MFCYLDPLFLASNGFKQFVMILWQKFGALTMKSLIYSIVSASWCPILVPIGGCQFQMYVVCTHGLYV